MNFDWLFSNEAPLPHGYRLAVLPLETDTLATRRLEEAGQILGSEEARETARKLGYYELDEESVRRLGLSGASTGKNGEFEALSPIRWTEIPQNDEWEEPQEETEVAGLLLTRSQRESFLKFLTRNHGEEEMDAQKAVKLARHFFFQEPVIVVLRYTPPRFARS
jgi:hypothetical protein